MEDEEELQARDGGRLDAFVDSAFAFAVTLLVIAGGSPPTDFDALRQALLRIPAFAAAFALLIVYWAAHREYGRLTPRRDWLSTLLSLAVVFTVLIYVFPLRMLTESAMRFFSGGGLDAGVRLRSFDDLAALYVVFGIGGAVLGLLITALFWHTARTPALTGPKGAREAAINAIDWGIVSGVSILSTALALLLPLNRVPWLPGFIYWIIPAAIGVRVVITKRRAARQATDASRTGP